MLLGITLPVSIVATAWVGQWRQLHNAVLVDLHVVLIWMGMGNIVSVLLPYRPIPLKERWTQRRRWRTLLRWGICLLVPYGLWVAFGWLGEPAVRMAHALYGRRIHHETQYAILSLVWGIGYWIAGSVIADRLATWRGARLLPDLRRPD